MRCPSCDCQNSEAAKFCDACGTALPLHCPACGAQNRTSAKFCNECGVVLGHQPSPKAAAAHATDKPQPADFAFALGAAVEAPVADGERKMITALFVDIMDSTELGQNLDPEEVRAIIDPALGLMIDAV